MNGLTLLRLGCGIAMALALAAPAADASPPGARPPSTQQVPAPPAGLLAARAPDLAVTEAFVGTLDAATNTYRPLGAEGVAVGQAFRVACFVMNGGAGFQGSFRVTHRVDGRVVAVSNPLAGLPNGARTVHGIPFTLTSEGSHRYECAVALDAATERVTSNNSLGTDFLVHGPATMVPRDRPGSNAPAGPVLPPRPSAVDLTVPQIFAQDGFWSTDWEVIGVAMITVTVKNAGMQEAPPRDWTWQWIVDGVPRGCDVTDPRFGKYAGSEGTFGLGPGESRAVTFTFRGVTDSDISSLRPGFVKQYRVKVRFNCDLGQSERDDSNNTSREIPVWFKTMKGLPGQP
jgi:hypothetical protein